MKTETVLCKHGHLVCPHCAIVKEALGKHDNRIQKDKKEPTKFMIFDSVNRRYY